MAWVLLGIHVNTGAVIDATWLSRNLPPPGRLPGRDSGPYMK